MLILFLATLLLPMGLLSQGERYQHPVYDISFKASPNWTENCKSTEVAEYCVVHPNNNMEISLKYVPDCRRPEKYMRRISVIYLFPPPLFERTGLPQGRI